MTKCWSCNTSIPDQSRFCPACGEPVELTATETHSPPEEQTLPPPRDRVVDDGTRSSDELTDRLLPGRVIANRYRIVRLLGVGGMGEVYQADDLKLRQVVALKFLSQGVENDPARLDYLLNEVRLARTISHPNVCRVYDVGEFGSRHSLSMEYINGEDLATLLRRIGRLPPDKATEVARGLCVGLAAAHGQGVLHRDLKPANIMLDGRGTVRITDFGLARLVDEKRPDEGRAGTPAYMAPEQATGRNVTVQSDLYSLGLVLYELFTGRRPFPAGMQRSGPTNDVATAPPAPSSIVSDIKAEVERAILQCLGWAPADRPKSALEVAAAFPGNDPLASALAAGETPAPEVVAAAGDRRGLRPRPAVACLVFVLIGVAAFVWVSDGGGPFADADLTMNPGALEQRAHDILRRLGYVDLGSRAADSAYGFEYHDANITARRQTRDARTTQSSPTVTFWYRESPNLLTPQRTWTRESIPTWSSGLILPDDPSPTLAGMVNLRLDPQGRLIEIANVVGDEKENSHDAEPVPLSLLLDLAGVQLDENSQVDISTPVSRLSGGGILWQSEAVREANVEQRVLIEIRTMGERVAFFRAVDLPISDSIARDPPRAAVQIISFVSLCALLAAAMLGVHNVRLGRIDRQGSLRFAMYVLMLVLLHWVFASNHRADLLHERMVFVFCLAVALESAITYGLAYLALEPYVRRLWPESLISWTRVLRGKFRDPLVGRDFLVGTSFAVGFALIIRSGVWAGVLDEPIPADDHLSALLGVRFAIGSFLANQQQAIFRSLVTLMSLLVLRLVLRMNWLAGMVFVVIFTAFQSILMNASFAGWVVIGIICGAWLFILTRFGLLTMAITFFGFLFLTLSPVSADLTAWHASTTVWTVGVVAAMACFGFYVSLAGQRLFEESGVRQS